MTNQDNCKSTDNDLTHTLTMGSTRAGMTGMSAITEHMVVAQLAAGAKVMVVDVGSTFENMAHDLNQLYRPRAGKSRLMSDMMNDVLAAAGGTPAVVDVGRSMEALAPSRKATPYWRQFDKRKF